MGQSLALVIPCQDATEYLDTEKLAQELEADVDLHYFFVNDGSEDGTLDTLASFCAKHSRANVYHLEDSRGKAEAIRQGVRKALKKNFFDLVGYWESHLSTSLKEVQSFRTIFKQRPDYFLVSGARIPRLGAQIRIPFFRRLGMRLFSLISSGIAGRTCYDLSSETKIFREDVASLLFEQKFATPLCFELELVLRLQRLSGYEENSERIYELPLHSWQQKQRPSRGLAEVLMTPWQLLRLYLLESE